MARPLRIEFPGALYHITTRGNAQQEIFQDEEDRQKFLDLLHNSGERHDWYCHAYCLMGNHYHLLIETAQPSLSRGMKYLNGTYTQFFNRRHQRVGHLFQGRFKGILVEKDAYLLELARYIVLNPVRARMVRSAKDWPWSSYRATAGFTEPLHCLTTDGVLGRFSKQRKRAHDHYRRFVRAGKNQPPLWESLKNQIYLGSDDFVEDMLYRIDSEQPLVDIPRRQKQSPPKSLSFYKKKYPGRDEAMAQAYLSGHYTLLTVGDYFGVSYTTVSRAVKWFEESVK